MGWLKRNLIYVIGGIIALAAIGGAYVFVNGASQRKQEAMDALGVYTNTVNRLISARPYPSVEAIDKVNNEAEVLKVFTAEAEKLFEYQKPRRMRSQDFKVHLINSLVKLRADATNNNIRIPRNFNFTFGHLLPMPNLLQYSIEPLSMHLQDVQEICRILYEARVHSITGIQRVTAYPREPGGAVLMGDVAVRTNLTTAEAVFTSTPLRFSFRGFTSELTEVLNLLASDDRFYVVRKVEVEGSRPRRATGVNAMLGGAGLMGEEGGAEAGGGEEGGGSAAMAPISGNANDLLRIAQMRAAAVLRARAARGGVVPQGPSLVTVVDEKPLQVTMLVDVVKVIRLPKPAN